MCSLRTNATFDELLADRLLNDKQRRMIENRIKQFAEDAKVDRPSGLDDPSLRYTHMPEDLRDVRHLTIGRHRVLFTGHHTQCHYFAFYLKIFKRTGVEDEGSRRFQDRMRGSLSEPEGNWLVPPDQS